MSTAVTQNDPTAQPHNHHDTAELMGFGFWLYILSDLVVFSILFATYTLLHRNIAGGPAGHELFDIHFVFVETLLLLTSSVTCGIAMNTLQQKRVNTTLIWLALTFLLGLGFVIMEIGEFRELIHEGHGPSRSAFLSAFFTLVGTHGLHVIAGLLWIVVMMIQLLRMGVTVPVVSRFNRLGVFWHFLDIVWVGVFSLVYLMGALK